MRARPNIRREAMLRKKVRSPTAPVIARTAFSVSAGHYPCRHGRPQAPNRPASHRGVSYTKRGEYDRAVTDLTEAIRLNPAQPVNDPDRAKAYRAMANANESAAGDPHDLNRFVQAQKGDYERALSEIRSGRKQSHWMWYIFPQFDGLGFSPTSRLYSIKSVAEAKAYLGHPVLGPRLVECAEAALRVEGRSAFEVFGSPDDMKLRSCATLFASVSPAGSVFDRLLDKYYQGERDARTLRLLGIATEAE
jgi:uncharacterized protein (DUF1810 family)